jgi:pyrroloquinoline quinone (PQQ) biosynthesis protein C
MNVKTYYLPCGTGNGPRITMNSPKQQERPPMFFMDLVSRTDEARREFESSSRVLDIVANGLPLERYRKLLLELYHLVWHFNPICAAAASRISDRHQHIRYFLYEHMKEEQGHEEWVLNDLRAIGTAAESARAYEPSFVMMGLSGYNYWSADRRHPCSVLGMVYSLEVVASVYGGQMTAAITDSLLLQEGRGISFISSHATLDAEHMAELRIILNGIADEEAQAAIVESTQFNFFQFGKVLELV